MSVEEFARAGIGIFVGILVGLIFYQLTNNNLWSLTATAVASRAMLRWGF